MVLPLPLTSASSNSAAAITRPRAARSSLAVSRVSLNPRPRPGVKASVDKVERDDLRPAAHGAGIYVAPHYRTNPDGYCSNNLRGCR